MKKQTKTVLIVTGILIVIVTLLMIIATIANKNKPDNTADVTDATTSDNQEEPDDNTITVLDGIIYTSNDNGTCYVSGYTESLPKTVIIPEKNSFGDTVVSIGERAFSEGMLESIVIPSSVKTIMKYAFLSCENLTNVEIPSGITVIGQGAFTSTAWLNSQEQSDFVIVGDGVLIKCNGASGVLTIPNEVKYISAAFDYSDRITKIIISSNVVGFEDNTFMIQTLTDIEVNSANPVYASAQGVLLSKDQKNLICYPYGKSEKTYTLPEGIVTVKSSAFHSVSSLCQVSFSSGVEIVEERAFSDCLKLVSINLSSKVRSLGTRCFSGTGLSQINIPAGVTEINDAFVGCQRLISVTVDENNQHFCAEEGVLYNKDKTAILCYPRNKSGASFTAEGITEIGKNAFNESLYLKNADLTGVKKICDGAFENCSLLATVNLGESLESIGDRAFYNCVLIERMAIPSTVTEISGSAFMNCTKIATFIIPTTNTAYCSVNGIIFSKDKTKLIQFPCGLNITDYTVTDTVTEICDNAFSSNKYLINIKCPAGLTTIGQAAFSRCSSLRNVTFANCPKTIGQSAFSGCTSLYQIVFANNLSKIESSLFSSCTALETITICDSVTLIESGAFYYCNTLKHVNYTASQAKWDEINIGNNNEILKDVEFSYNYVVK